MKEPEFANQTKQSVKETYPKGKLKPASTLNEEELNLPGRFNDIGHYQNFIDQNTAVLYIAVPAAQADALLERFLELANGEYLVYTSRCKHYDKDPKDSLRIVFLNSTDPLAGIRREGSFGGDSGLSNEDILSHFEYIQPAYHLRFEEISSNTVAGTVQKEINLKEAEMLAGIMFEFNPETANFIADDEDGEEELDFYEDAPYFISKLAKQLHENKTFYYWWD